MHDVMICAMAAALLLVSATRSSAHTFTAVGEVSATTATVWGRCEQAGTLRVNVASAPPVVANVSVSAERDFTGRAVLTQLRPDTNYRYDVRCEVAGKQAGSKESGEFRTAPASDSSAAVRFAWSGDLGGQNTCRDRKTGYAIFDRIVREHPAFFIALGDMIYADDPCRARGRYGNEQVPGLDHPATTLADFWSVWRYNRADRSFQHFLNHTPIFPVWDDHEIMNDSGPHRDTLPDVPGVHLFEPARQSFLDYQPLVPPDDDATRMHRSARWGRHVEVFLLDARQYRDANEAPDDVQHPKSMLGAAQRAWFVQQLSASDATWKIVVSSVPISIPTCSGGRGCDGWANLDQPTGFEQELLGILRALRDAKVRNMLWVTTDVHFAAGFHYLPFPEDRDFELTELVAGPLNAGVFPQNAYDLTLGTERLFFYGPTDPRAITSFATLRPWLNFGVVDVDEDGTLRAHIVNGDGRTVAERVIMPR